MVQQITRMSVHQTAKVFGVLYTVMGLLIIPVYLVSRFTSSEGEGMHPGLLVLLPLLYGAVGYVFVALGCLVYNAVSSRIGGIEFTLGAGIGPGNGTGAGSGAGRSGGPGSVA